MTLEILKDDVRELGEDDFTQLLSWILNDERKRRAELPAVQKAQEQLIHELRESGVLPAHEVPEEPSAVDDFPEWESPVNGDHSYMVGDLVQHDGKVWKSTYQGCNKETPGSWVAGDMWVDVTSEVLPADENTDDAEETQNG